MKSEELSEIDERIPDEMKADDSSIVKSSLSGLGMLKYKNITP